MLAKPLRLNLADAKWRYRNSDFQTTSPDFKIVAKKTSEPSRFGFLVTSKVGSATKRNQVKRWLSEAVFEQLESFPSGFDFIFIAYPSASGGNYEKIRSSLNQVLPKISLLR